MNIVKNILILITACFMLSPLAVSAADADVADGGECDTVFCGGGLEEGKETLEEEVAGTGIPKAGLIAMIFYWVKILLIICGILAFVALVWAGFLYITSFASEENAGKAKKIIIYAIIGLIVIIFSYAIVTYFTSLGQS